MRARRGTIAIASTLGALSVTAAIALAGTPNGNFEQANFSHWKVYDSNEAMDRAVATGKWQVYRGKLKGGLSRGGFEDANLPKPPQGTYAAGLSTHSPGNHILHRVMDADVRSKVKLKLAYNNVADDFYVQDHLSQLPPTRRGMGGGEDANQQLRVDLMEPGAPLESLEKSDILKKVFRTKPGDKLKRRWFKLKQKIGPGEFRLRIAEVDNQAPFAVGVDAVKLKPVG